MTTELNVPGELILTGATGFLGHHLLAELLQRQWVCTVLLRPPLEASRIRLFALLNALGVDADTQVGAGALRLLEGALPEPLPSTAVAPETRLVHTAAATRFEPDATGDPHRTNVKGTAALLAWADARGIRDVHLVSSAYSCGRVNGPVDEVFNPDPPNFHNAYERSKWDMERLAFAWGKTQGRRTTIYRPSIIVGDYETGRATRFGGFYFSARATELVERLHHDRTPHERQGIALRICGRPGDRQNIVPVDYVASMIAAIVCNEAWPGRIYHLVHPEPPSNLRIKQAFEGHFGIAGGRFIEPETMEPDDLNDAERAFFDASRSIRHYFVDTPRFNRAHAARDDGGVDRNADRTPGGAMLRGRRTFLPRSGSGCRPGLPGFFARPCADVATR